jgi:hypothetical protein
MTLLREAFDGARRFGVAVETASQTAELLADHG